MVGTRLETTESLEISSGQEKFNLGSFYLEMLDKCRRKTSFYVCSPEDIFNLNIVKTYK